MMVSILGRYARWLHTRWPAGTVEKLPEVAADGSTNVAGLYVVGDLAGIPLLKFAVDGGARVVETICADPSFQAARDDAEVLDLVIVGGGVAGLAAAIEARRRGLRFEILEASEPFSTVVNFPRRKPIFTYPTEMVPRGELQLGADVKEELLEELRAAAARHRIEPRAARVAGVRRGRGRLEVELAEDGARLVARRVILAIGRSGNFRRLGVPGEELELVSNRLHDPADLAGERVLVVGGGDSALETAIAIVHAGGHVTLSYRGRELARPKPENLAMIEALVADPSADVEVEEPSSERVTTPTGPFEPPPERPGSLELLLGSRVERIEPEQAVVVDAAGERRELPIDQVFTMIGREPPLPFLRRCGVRIQGETSALGWIALAAFLLAMVALYDWKGFGFLSKELPRLSSPEVFPNNLPAWLSSLGAWWAEAVGDRRTLIGTVAISMKSRSFWYTLAYTTAIGVFGWLRIRRRRTPYVRLQTVTLFLVQLIPLFLLPEVVLPLAGYNGAFDHGVGASVADSLFERYIPAEQDLAGEWPDWGHPRAYWRAYGFILAWPLMVYNVFTANPMPAWLVIAVIQTFVLIPLLVWKWGKGAYCGWICSCGGLAETMGDTQRHKMPHGPRWNRLNLLGQGILFAAFALLAVRIWGWLVPSSWAATHFDLLLEGKSSAGELVNPGAWKWSVDVLLGGILGVGLYFKYSGRVWCRFACPLAALMHVYARFSRFRILAEKKKCISCNVCTSVCHQGIDVMSFANKGLPMADPQCVRCSACVQSCPTGVLAFGEVGAGGEVIRLDSLGASPVRMREG